MKIAINHTRFASTGGVERYLFNLVKRLLSAGHEIHYYCYKWEPFHHPNLFFHRVPYIKGIRFLRIFSFAFFSKLMLQGKNYDLILGFGKTYYQDIYRDGYGCLKDYQKYSLGIIKNPLRRFLRKISLYQQTIQAIENIRYKPGNFKKIIATSEWIKRQILNYHAVRPDQIEVVYSGADIETFHPRNKAKYREKIRNQFGIGENELVLLFVGNDFKRKALDTILKAIPLLRNFASPLRVLIVGTDRHEKDFFILAKNLGVTKETIFVGHQADIAPFYAASDIFVLPSRFDPFPNAVLEAMATGLPVIVSSTNGTKEIVGGGGLIVNNPDSETELAEKIKILFDREKREEMGINARKKAETMNWEVHMENIFRIYREIYTRKKNLTAKNSSTNKKKNN